MLPRNSYSDIIIRPNDARFAWMLLEDKQIEISLQQIFQHVLFVKDLALALRNDYICCKINFTTLLTSYLHLTHNFEVSSYNEVLVTDPRVILAHPVHYNKSTKEIHF